LVVRMRCRTRRPASCERPRRELRPSRRSTPKGRSWPFVGRTRSRDAAARLETEALRVHLGCASDTRVTGAALSRGLEDSRQLQVGHDRLCIVGFPGRCKNGRDPSFEEPRERRLRWRDRGAFRREGAEKHAAGLRRRTRLDRCPLTPPRKRPCSRTHAPLLPTTGAPSSDEGSTRVGSVGISSD